MNVGCFRPVQIKFTGTKRAHIAAVIIFYKTLNVLCMIDYFLHMLHVILNYILSIHVQANLWKRNIKVGCGEGLQTDRR